jgi:hypothetical protein
LQGVFLRRRAVGQYHVQKFVRWRLIISPTNHHEFTKLELQGLGNPRTVQDLCRLVKEKRPDMVFLMETKLQIARLESLKLKLGFDCVFVVDCKGRSGGLALFWKEELQVVIQNYSMRHINGKVYSEAHDIT